MVASICATFWDRFLRTCSRTADVRFLPDGRIALGGYPLPSVSSTTRCAGNVCHTFQLTNSVLSYILEMIVRQIITWGKNNLPKSMSLDGIDYFLQVDTDACEMAIDFSMPQTPVLISLKSFMFEAAQEVIMFSDSSKENNYLNVWKRHLRQ